MSEAAPPERTRRDACPGALQVHEAADGGLARVRVPGGELTPRQFRALGRAAAEFGDGALELTSRANLQVRGLASGSEHDFAARLADAGLLPSETHERVRNIIASPYAGCDGRELWDVHAVVRELDGMLCDNEELSALPGRFLFTVDDGRADVAALGADAGLLGMSADVVALLLAGTDSGLRVRPSVAARVAVVAAEAFLSERAAQGSQVWRIAELTDGPQRIAARVAAALDEFVPERALRIERSSSARVTTRQTHSDVSSQSEPVVVPVRAPTTHAQVGEVCRRDGRATVAVGAPLGRLSAEQVDIITAASDAAGGLRLTPWRTVVLPALPAGDAGAWMSDLQAGGLVVDPSSQWAGVTACTGRPGCAKALADVREDAERALRRPGAQAGELPVHWVGCERRCGRPQGPVVEVLATQVGYEVVLDGETQVSAADVDQVSAALDAARRTV